MKKILLLLSIFIIGIFSFNYSYAGDLGCFDDEVKIGVTEKIPGLECSDDTDYGGTIYCCVGKGMSGIYSTMSGIIKYFTLLAAMGGVLFIVINGIQLSMGGMDSGVKESAKKRIVQTISGLVVLLLSGVILNSIAPWIYK